MISRWSLRRWRAGPHATFRGHVFGRRSTRDVNLSPRSQELRLWRSYPLRGRQTLRIGVTAYCIWCLRWNGRQPWGNEDRRRRRLGRIYFFSLFAQLGKGDNCTFRASGEYSRRAHKLSSDLPTRLNYGQTTRKTRTYCVQSILRDTTCNIVVSLEWILCAY